MYTLASEKKLAVIASLLEGNSVRSTERMTGVHRDTICRLLVQVGDHCAALMDERMRNLHCGYIQADEIWTYVGKCLASTTLSGAGRRPVPEAQGRVTSVVRNGNSLIKQGITVWHRDAVRA
jgi:hypothetical protein